MKLLINIYSFTFCKIIDREYFVILLLIMLRNCCDINSGYSASVEKLFHFIFVEFRRVCSLLLFTKSMLINKQASAARVRIAFSKTFRNTFSRMSEMFSYLRNAAAPYSREFSALLNV